MSDFRSRPPASRGLDDEALSRAFRALGNRHRLTIVLALLKRSFACCTSERVENCRLDPASCNVGDLAALVDAAPSTVSHHLKELEDAGLIERAREGRYLYCRVNRDMLDHLVALLGGSKGSSEGPESERSSEGRAA